MKKNFIIIFLILLIISVFNSCTNEDFLKEIPKDRLTADNLYLTPSGFENGLNAMYSFVRQERDFPGNETAGFHGAMSWITQGATDDYYSSRYASVGWFFVYYGTYLNSTTPAVETVWDWCYEIINSANTIIGRSENSDVKWESDEQKNTIVAQARLIRAWSYRHLIYCWGDVPLTLEESTGANVKTDWSREPKENIMKKMEEDLLFAEQYLPDIQDVPGRLNKVVAQHYLAELYLMMEEPAKAEEKAQAAIENPNYSLITERYGVKADQPGVPFMDQFYDGNVFHNEGNTEVLWEMPHDRDANGGGGNIMRRSWVIRYSANSGVSVSSERGRGSDFYAVTKHAWSLYEPNDDRGSIYAVYRFILTDSGDTLFTDFESDEPERYKLWPSTRKWEDGDSSNPGRDAGYNDQPYLRLAETYLLLAEAQFLQEKNVEAAETINIVRKRSNASEISATDVNIDFILNERTRELLTEEHRRYTLLRLNKWLERTEEFNSQSGSVITERDELLPIPQVVIDANLDAEIPQNPSY